MTNDDNVEADEIEAGDRDASDALPPDGDGKINVTIRMTPRMYHELLTLSHMTGRDIDHVVLMGLFVFAHAAKSMPSRIVPPRKRK